MSDIRSTYLVNQILLGHLTYQEIITKRPKYQTGIDKYIEDHDLERYIDKTK